MLPRTLCRPHQSKSAIPGQEPASVIRARTLPGSEDRAATRASVSPLSVPTGFTGEAARGSVPALAGAGPKNTQSARPGG